MHFSLQYRNRGWRGYHKEAEEIEPQNQTFDTRTHQSITQLHGYINNSQIEMNSVAASLSLSLSLSRFFSPLPHLRTTCTRGENGRHPLIVDDSGESSLQPIVALSPSPFCYCNRENRQWFAQRRPAANSQPPAKYLVPANIISQVLLTSPSLLEPERSSRIYADSLPGFCDISI